MRIFAFTDIHGNLPLLHTVKRRILEENVDLVLLTGDFTIMGRQMSALLSRINLLHKPVFLIHGNHEDEEELTRALERLPHLTFLHKRILHYGGWWFGAYATSGMRTSYPEQEQWVREHDEEISRAAATGRLVWLDHPPPESTLLDEISDGLHVGSRSLRQFIEKYRPAYVFCGHIHEAFGREEMIGETVVINPGPNGKVIDLEERA